MSRAKYRGGTATYARTKTDAFKTELEENVAKTGMGKAAITKIAPANSRSGTASRLTAGRVLRGLLI